MKICKKCKVEKPLTEYHVRPRKKFLDGYESYCKPCHNLRVKNWSNSPNGKASSKRIKLRQYGMTPEEYDAMYDIQNGCCSICDKWYKVLCIDHNHITNKVRGLLCKACNLIIGNADDRIDTLYSAIEYLNHYM
jgi:hypothetical protein